MSAKRGFADKLMTLRSNQNVCGMSVVGPDYETLKRYNLAEIYESKVEEAKVVDGS